jgi:hypothetical protein
MRCRHRRSRSSSSASRLPRHWRADAPRPHTGDAGLSRVPVRDVVLWLRDVRGDRLPTGQSALPADPAVGDAVAQPSRRRSGARRRGGEASAYRAIRRACGMQQPPCLDTREYDADPALGGTFGGQTLRTFWDTGGCVSGRSDRLILGGPPRGRPRGSRSTRWTRTLGPFGPGGPFSGFARWG